MRGFRTIVLSDGCAAFEPEAHTSTIASFGTMITISRIDEVLAGFGKG